MLEVNEANSQFYPKSADFHKRHIWNRWEHQFCRWITSKVSQKLRNYRKTLSNNLKHCQTLSHSLKHSQTMSNTVKHSQALCQTLSNTVRQCQTLSNTLKHCVRHCQSLSITVKHCQTLSNTVKHCQTLSKNCFFKNMLLNQLISADLYDLNICWKW